MADPYNNPEEQITPISRAEALLLQVAGPNVACTAEDYDGKLYFDMVPTHGATVEHHITPSMISAIYLKMQPAINCLNKNDPIAELNRPEDESDLKIVIAIKKTDLEQFIAGLETHQNRSAMAVSKAELQGQVARSGNTGHVKA